MENIKIKVINESNNKLPEYKNANDAGMDLRAYINGTNTKLIYKCSYVYGITKEEIAGIFVPPMGRVVVDTGLKIELPIGYEAQIRPRSGLSAKNGIVAILGTIDSPYRGNIGIIIINFSDTAFVISNGDRIAQMVINKVEKCEWEQVEELSETDRSEGGFGHTGIK